MRAHAAPGWDTSHRDIFPPQVRAAMSTLDRVAGGEHVPQFLIDQALLVTGDVEPRTLSPNESARVRAFAGAY